METDAPLCKSFYTSPFLTSKEKANKLLMRLKTVQKSGLRITKLKLMYCILKTKAAVFKSGESNPKYKPSRHSIN